MQQRFGGSAQAGIDLSQRGDKVSQKTRGIVILFVERQPRDRMCHAVQPLGRERGLAIASRGADDGEFVPRAQSPVEALDEVRSRHEVRPAHGDQQLVASSVEGVGTTILRWRRGIR